MKCSPKIWAKFNKTEKELWTLFYKIFAEENNFHTDWVGKEFKKQREVTAHNLACQVVWELSELPEK